MWTHLLQTPLDCIGSWPRAASYASFRSDRGPATLWYVTFGNIQEAETTLTRLADQLPSQTLRVNKSPPTVPLPPLPAFTNMGIGLRSGRPTTRFAYILSPIYSAPALASIAFTSEGWWYG
jgi:hypothetical protein